MKSILLSIALAFSTYSRVPMPQIRWDEIELIDPLSFFPLVGIVLAALFALIYEFVNPLGHLFQATILCCVPLLFTGGIHMDGFLDTSDALASYQSKEKRLDILKDPHTGAFAIIFCAVYLLLQLGIYGLISKENISLVAVGFVVSRTTVLILTLFTKNARQSGMLFTMQSKQQRVTSIGSVIGFVLLITLFGINTNLIVMTISLGIIFLTAFFLQRHILVLFGGITGDLAGYCLQVFELLWSFLTILLMRYIP